MAVDIVRDLDLNQAVSPWLSDDEDGDGSCGGSGGSGEPIDGHLLSEERLSGMRAILGTYYLAASCVYSPFPSSAMRLDETRLTAQLLDMAPLGGHLQHWSIRPGSTRAARRSRPMRHPRL